MPEPKAQLVDPQGPIDVPGINATGIITATGGFVGAVQGAATGLAATTYNISAGVVTSTGFVGDVTGTASSVTKGANLSVGVMTASSFAGDVFGNAAGLSTTTAGLKLGIVSATSFAGNFTGIGSGITGTPHIQAGVMTATSFAGNFTGLASGLTGTPNLMVGILTGTAYSGDGSNLTGIAATNWIANNVTANSSTTTVDLALGNVVKFTQSANTTVSFANTGTSNIVSFIRANGTGTLTWPSSVKWTNGVEPTLLANPRSTDAQVFTFLTRDEGVTWYAWEDVNIDPQDTELWGWGSNSQKTLTGPRNLTPTGNRSAPIQISTSDNWNILTDEGNTGMYSLLAIKTDNTLWTWGANSDYYTLANNGGPGVSSPIQIPGSWSNIWKGSSQVIGVKTNGTLWMWGKNTMGNLGQNNRTHYSSPVQVPGTTWSGAVGHISAGHEMAGAIKTDGSLWMWGAGHEGQLAQNNLTKYSSPVQIPGTDWSLLQLKNSSNVAAIRTNGTLWTWGANGWGSLGRGNAADGPSGGRSSPCQVGSDTTWKNIMGSANSFIANKTDGTLWAWGYQSAGEPTLGLGNLNKYSSPVQIPGTTWGSSNPSYDRQDLGDGYTARAAVRTDGTIWTWGYNEVTQLGLSHSYSPASSPTRVQSSSSPRQVPGTDFISVRGTTYGKGFWALKQVD